MITQDQKIIVSDSYGPYRYSGRAQADKQMRLLFAEFAERVKLYGVSTFGVQVGYCELEGTDSSIYPGEILYDGNYVTDVAPVNRWRYNILSEGG
jgi:hypothetical protein